MNELHTIFIINLLYAKFVMCVVIHSFVHLQNQILFD